jgi:hypothetical protein
MDVNNGAVPSGLWISGDNRRAATRAFTRDGLHRDSVRDHEQAKALPDLVAHATERAQALIVRSLDAHRIVEGPADELEVDPAAPRRQLGIARRRRDFVTRSSRTDPSPSGHGRTSDRS